MKSHRKVLIVSANPINRVNGNGIMMASLFEALDVGELIQVYMPTATDFVCDSSIRARYMRIGLSGQVELVEAGASARSGKIRMGFAASQWSPIVQIREVLRELIWLGNGSGDAVLKIIRKERPDVVYSLLGGLSFCRLLTRIGEERCANTALHFTDNWLDTLYLGSVGESLLRGSLLRQTRRAVSRARSVAAISPTMAEEYGGLFGRRFEWFTTCVRDLRVPERLTRRRRCDSEVVLLYAGGVGIGRLAALRDVAVAVEGLRGVDVVFEVFGSADSMDLCRAAMVGLTKTKLMGWLDAASLAERMSGASLLVHVESFDVDQSKYTRLSLSTKISGYLASGTAILAYGPAGIASVEYLRKNDVGPVVDRQDVGVLAERLRSVCKQRDELMAWGDRAYSLACSHFRADVVRPRFRGWLMGEDFYGSK